MPVQQQLVLFKRELWKDQRRLDTHETPEGLVLRKHFANQAERETELHVLEWLGCHARAARVPTVLSATPEAVDLEYIHGIRLFNLLVELDRLPSRLRSRGEQTKQELLRRANVNQREIQGLLAAVPRLDHWRPYPAGSKILRIVEVLAPSLDFVFEEEGLRREIEALNEQWSELTAVPFRDATTKNMVLAAPDLWIGGFDGEEERRQLIARALEKSCRPDWLDAKIIDFDFASCGEISTPEDDFISLNYHERTWRQPPTEANGLLWGDLAPNPIRAALTFITRYYRFGGRKAAYRLLHPWGHKVRFRHDGDVFYFERLPAIVRAISPVVAERYPVLMGVTAAIARTLESGRPAIDRFIAAGLGEKRNYFVDMYWDRPPDDA
jgi:hypothetical protein